MSDMREQIEHALSEVLWNSNNYPNPVAVLGRDISVLREKCVEAVLPIVEAAYQEGFDSGASEFDYEDQYDPGYCCEECDGY